MSYWDSSALGKLYVQEWGSSVFRALAIEAEQEFGLVLYACFSRTPPIFIRTSDTLQLASAKLARELEFLTADVRESARRC